MTPTVGYSLEWVASEVGVPKRRIEDWIAKGLLRGPGKGRRDGYTHEFVLQALIVHEWLQLYPRGPVENLRDILYPEPEEDEE